MSSVDGSEQQFQSKVLSLREALIRLEGHQSNKTKPTAGLKKDLEKCSAEHVALSRLGSQMGPSLPPHGQKTLNETLKSLAAQLDALRNTIQPRQKFTFKKRTASSPTFATSSEPPPNKASFDDPANTSSDPTGAPTTTMTTTTGNEVEECDSKPEPAFPPSDHPVVIRRPSFSASSLIRIASHADLHLSVPPTASLGGKTATLLSLTRSIVNLPTWPAPPPSSSSPSLSSPSSPLLNSPPHSSSSPSSSLSTLSARQISHSILLLGRVDGPVHLTGLRRCLVVVSCRQFRLHESEGVDVYLSCTSEPVVERCRRVRFGALPGIFDPGRRAGEDRWRGIRDFDWVGAGQSPNWRVIGEGEQGEEEDRKGEPVQDEVWGLLKLDQLRREDALGALLGLDPGGEMAG